MWWAMGRDPEGLQEPEIQKSGARGQRELGPGDQARDCGLWALGTLARVALLFSLWKCGRGSGHSSWCARAMCSGRKRG